MKCLRTILSALVLLSSVSAAASEADSCVAAATQAFQADKSQAARSLELKYDRCHRQNDHADKFEDCLTAALYRHSAAVKAAQEKFDSAVAACQE